MVEMTVGAIPERGTRWFHVFMALAVVAVAFGGFMPTYWTRLGQPSFSVAPIIHIHGALFFAWTLFFLAQTLLVATGRVQDHRAWGLAGISLATAMGISVVLASINSMKVADSLGVGDAGRQFSIVALSALVLFGTFITLAIVNVRRPEAHRRYMLLAVVPLLHAAMARVFMTLFAPAGAVGPPPIFVAVPPGLFVDLFIVAAMAHDWRTRGRPHRIYVVGGACIVAVQLLIVPLGAMSAWTSIAGSIQGLAG